MNTRRPQKFVLSIGYVARRTGLPTSALRFYEEKALIGSIRTPGNQRCYTHECPLGDDPLPWAFHPPTD